MMPPFPTPNEPQPDLLHQLFLEISCLDSQTDRQGLLSLYTRIRELMMDIIEADPYPNRYTNVIIVLKSADGIAAQLTEDMDLTAFRRLKEHIKEANGQIN